MLRLEVAACAMDEQAGNPRVCTAYNVPAAPNRLEMATKDY